MTPLIVTTCMGRLEHLKRSLPTWLEQTTLDVLVVDYACPDGTADWVESLRNPRIESMRVNADLITHRRPIFNKSRALNIALEHYWTHYVPAAIGDLASDSECSITVCVHGSVLLLDADTLIQNPLTLDVKPCEMWVVEPAPLSRDLTGVLAADVDQLLACGGFDESMSGWGGEDIDLRARLFLQVKPEIKLLPAATFSAIAHDDALRSKYYVEQDLLASSNRNLRLMSQRLGQDGLSALASSGHAELLLASGAKRE